MYYCTLPRSKLTFAATQIFFVTKRTKTFIGLGAHLISGVVVHLIQLFQEHMQLVAHIACYQAAFGTLKWFY